MASRMSTSAWSGSAVDLSTSFRPADDREEAFDQYQSMRNMEWALDSSMYWQYRQCLKDGYQVTDESGQSGCRGEVPNVGCMSYDPGRAGYERLQQQLDAGLERQLDVPDKVADLFAQGYDLDQAYKKAGVAGPIDLSAPSIQGANMGEPSRTLVRGGIGASGKQRLAVNAGMSGSTVGVGMTTAAAYRGDRVVSVFENGAPAAFAGGKPAGTPAPGAKPGPGAQMYARTEEQGVARAPASAGLYQQAAAGGRLETVWQS